jgi:hypothetical protein
MVSGLRLVDSSVQPPFREIQNCDEGKMNVKSTVSSVERNLHSHGLRATMYDVAVRAANTFLTWKNLQCITITEPNPACVNLTSPYRYAVLDREALLSFSKTDEYELSLEFVIDALDKGDECHAILHGDELASYGWYSSKPTLLNDELRVHFSRDYLYMYKGFTRRAHRGHRLHAIGMTLALMKYRADGYAGLVSIVETNNFDSLKSCYRMGYAPCGNIRYVKVAGTYLIRADSVCKAYGMDLRSVPRVNGNGSQFSREQILPPSQL